MFNYALSKNIKQLRKKLYVYIYECFTPYYYNFVLYSAKKLH